MDRSRWLVVGACAIGTIALAEGIAQAPRSAVRTIINVAPADHFAVPFPIRTAMDLSADGEVLVFNAGDTRQRLYRRALNEAEATPIAGTDGASSPFLSPDGKMVAFFANGELKKVPLDGGMVTTICKVRGGLGASWGLDNTIVSGQSLGPLWQVPATGGAPSELTALDTSRGETGHRLPQILPGGDAVLFTITYNWLPQWKDSQIAVYSRRTKARKVLITGGADGRYVPSGHLVYAREGVLLAAPFDLERLEVTGRSVAVGDVLQNNYGTDVGPAQFRVSQSGTLIYMPPVARQEEARSIAWVDRTTGREEPLPIRAGKYFGPRISPEGRRLVFYEMERDVDVWMFDTRGNTLTRVTTEGRNGQPFWSPDGNRIVYRSAVTGPDNIYWRAANRTDMPERLATSLRNQVATTFTPDGKGLIVQEVSNDLLRGEVSVIVVPLDRKGSPRPLMEGASGPELSPDGQWLAYHANRTGRDEVYVQPYLGPGPAVQVSREGGMMPVWRRDGKELFYWVPGSGGGGKRTLMGAPITGKPSFQAGAPKVVLEGPYYVSSPGRSYDVAPDGQRFALVRADDRVNQPPLTDMIVVRGWVEELKQRMLVRRPASQQ
jgi:serine/threonine-protein kinase